MTTRREYAISLGLAQPGRGRMSREANEAIRKAEDSGMTFSDSKERVDPYKGSAVKRAAEEKARKVQRVVQESPESASKPFTGKFEVEIPGGKRKALSERTACVCGASLCYCRCKTPTVYRTIVDPSTDNVDEVLNIQRV